DRVKAAYPTWSELLELPLARFKRLIVDAGLSNQKAPRILAILNAITRDYGSPSLDSLHQLPDDEVERYLTSLPGVGVKTAKCVMMYSLGRAVLPVDPHVWRVATRLGLIPVGLSPATSHQALEANIAPRDRYSFHVNSISHGRGTCIPLRPR